MAVIKVFTSPDHVCYTFVFLSVISVFIGYVVNVLEIEEKVLWLLVFFALLSALLLLCKIIHRIAIAMDRLFDKWK